MITETSTATLFGPSESEGRFQFYGVPGEPGTWRCYREIEGKNTCLGRVIRGKDNIFSAIGVRNRSDATGFTSRRTAADFLLSLYGEPA